MDVIKRTALEPSQVGSGQENEGRTTETMYQPMRLLQAEASWEPPCCDHDDDHDDDYDDILGGFDNVLTFLHCLSRCAPSYQPMSCMTLVETKISSLPYLQDVVYIPSLNIISNRLLDRNPPVIQSEKLFTGPEGLPVEPEPPSVELDLHDTGS